jgi:predicted amidohydrolase
MKIALCQNIPENDTSQSVNRVLNMIDEAAGNGADLIALPEMFYCPYNLNSISTICGNEDAYIELLKASALKNSIYLCTGTMAVAENDCLYNRSFLVDPNGDIVGKYDKCHLYDVNLPGLKVQESSVFTRGESVLVIKTPFATIGIMVCYDIRFPEFARKYALAGVDVLLVPSVFNEITGAAHWHVLMRGRAIENQIFIAAISQGLFSGTSYKAFGHSLVVSPWGDILAEGLRGEEIVYSIIDVDTIKSVREKLPLLAHRRPEMY